MAAADAPSLAACGSTGYDRFAFNGGVRRRRRRRVFSESVTGTTAARPVPGGRRSRRGPQLVRSAAARGVVDGCRRVLVWPAAVSAPTAAMTESVRIRHHPRRPGTGHSLGGKGVGDARPASAGTATATSDVAGTAGQRSSPQRQTGPAQMSVRSLSLHDSAARPAATRMAANGGPTRLSGHQSALRGWAKIIRPATVWRTRVTVTDLRGP